MIIKAVFLIGDYFIKKTNKKDYIKKFDAVNKWEPFDSVLGMTLTLQVEVVRQICVQNGKLQIGVGESGAVFCTDDRIL